MIAILGIVTTAYGMAGAMAILFQARNMVACHCSANVSLRFMATYVGGYALFLAYGLTIASLTLILSDSVGLLCGAFTIAVAIRYHNSHTVKGSSR